MATYSQKHNLFILYEYSAAFTTFYLKIFKRVKRLQQKRFSITCHAICKDNNLLIKKDTFLAHLSQRLMGELIVYTCSGVRPYVVVHNFKHLLLQNPLLYQSQILCGASLGRGNESLFATSGSHDQEKKRRYFWLTSRKHLRTKVTSDFHLTYCKNGGNLGSESK